MKKRLNIAIFHLAFLYAGGGEKLVLEEANGLRKKGHKVTIYVPIVKKKECYPELIKKVTIRTFLPSLPHFIPEYEAVQILLSCVLVPFYAGRFKSYNVIFAANQPSLWIAWVVKKIYKVPYVGYLAQPTRFLYPRKIDNQTGLIFFYAGSVSLTAKIMHLTRKFIAVLDRVSIQGAPVILENGDYINKILHKTYQIKTIACPAGARPAKKISLLSSRMQGALQVNKHNINKPFMLISNRHFSQKKFEYAIFVLSAVLSKYPHFSLVITGGFTTYTEKIKSLAKRFSLQDKIIFLGFVSEADLARLYAHACVYLYTAPQEDFGMGIVEAMAQGTPVVAWRSGGPAGIITHEHSGLLASPFKIQDFTKQVLRILEDRRLANSISKNAWITVKQKFSLDRHINQVEKYLLHETYYSR